MLDLVTKKPKQLCFSSEGSNSKNYGKPTSSVIAPSSLFICSDGLAGLLSVTASAIDLINVSLSACELPPLSLAVLGKALPPADFLELFPSFVEELAVLPHVRTGNKSDCFLFSLRPSLEEQGGFEFSLTIWQAERFDMQIVNQSNACTCTGKLIFRKKKKHL